MSALKNLGRALIPASLRPALAGVARAVGLMPQKAPYLPFAWPFRELMRVDMGPKAHYRWGTYCAALLAKNLGIPRISVIEFGVAGGTGLVALERAAADAEARSGVKIDVYGFDTGKGLPKPVDYRDLPHLWREGEYKMDVPKLKARLSRAELILGDVKQTAPEFVKRQPAPIGFVSFDVDMYSSTMDALQVFRGNHAMLLPRVTCYFDDIIGYSYSDFTGERLAISDFNQVDAKRKLSRLYGLWVFMGLRQWTEMMYMLHIFDHPRANDFDGTNLVPELPLRG